MATALHSIMKMPAIAAIRSSVLASLIKHLDATTAKTDTLLAEHGLLRSQLQDEYALVPMARYIALFEQAAEVLGDANLGARLGQTQESSEIGPIGLLFSLSPTIRTAFHRVSKYLNALQGGTATGVFEENGDLVWTYRLIDPRMWPRRQDSEFTILTACLLVRSYFGRSWCPRAVHFEHAAPRDTTILQQTLRAPISFEQSGNRLVIAKEDADHVYRQEDPVLIAVLERHIADLSPEAESAGTLADRVRAIIGLYLGHKSITLAVVASELKLSQRTLQRHLEKEGLSLRDLVSEHRQRLVEMHMSAGNSNKGIAEALGYADSTAFWRARKRWSHKRTAATE